MTVHLHSRSLFRGRLVRLDDVACTAPAGGCEAAEHAHGPAFVLVRRGVFRKHVGRAELIADPGLVVFFEAGEEYRVSHPVAGGDDCTSFAFDEGVLDEALPEGRGRARFRVSHARFGARAALAAARLRRALREPGLEPIDVEGVAMRLLGEMARAPASRPAPGPRRPATRAAHRRWVDRARLLIAERFRERLTLDEIARAVACSPYHLERLFRLMVGVPLHRHLSGLRLHEALHRIADGEPDLSSLALDLGFSSHSHFTASFRSAFGVAPSAIRRAEADALRRQTSRISKARGSRAP